MHLSKRITLVLSISLVVAAVSSDASAQNAGVIHACVRTNSGALRVVAANEDCARNEIRVQWNIGPQGPAPEPMQAVVFQHAWQDVRPEHSPAGIEYENVRYFRDANRVVHIQGVTITGDIVPGLQTIFILPAGYRPAKRLIFTAACSNAGLLTCRVDVAPNGAVIIVPPLTNGEFVSFAGMSFRAAD